MSQVVQLTANAPRFLANNNGGFSFGDGPAATRHPDTSRRLHVCGITVVLAEMNNSIKLLPGRTRPLARYPASKGDSVGIEDSTANGSLTQSPKRPFAVFWPMQLGERYCNYQLVKEQFLPMKPVRIA